jgi:phosphorylase kinase alpha/beta subunit
MTSGELKFALAVETVLNWIPHPEYRQLIVETLMIFALYAENEISPRPSQEIITIEDFVHKANELFLQDQVRS